MSLLVLCLAAAGLVAALTSAFTGLCLRWVARGSGGRSAASQARLLIGGILLPGLSTVAVMVAALAPLLGWVADHCVQGVHPHGHPHICTHYSAAMLTPPIVLVAGLFGARAAWILGRQVWLGWVSGRTARRLAASAGPAEPSGAYVLPVDAPQAFVVGVLRPRLFLTRGLLDPAHRAHLPAVHAHEAAHASAGHAAWRWLTGLGLAFHLPGLARWLQSELACAHEMSADEVAAKAIGSRAAVARALLHVARHAVAAPTTAHAFGASDLERRVRGLLADGPRREAPRPSTLLAFAGGLTLAVGASATFVHHAVEHLLGLLAVI